MLRTLLEPFDLSSSQHNEMAIAYDENPAGFTALVARVSTAKNPTAALIATVRKGEHDGAERTATTSSKPARDTLEDIVSVGVRSYNARVAKYPPNDEVGWTDDDAIAYAVVVASSWNSRLAQDDIERALRVRLGKPWTTDQDPVLGTGCPPELLANVLAKLGRIGVMPDPKPIVAPDREPVVELTLAERLLEMAGKAA